MLALAGAARAAAPLDFAGAIALARQGPDVALARLALRSAEAARDATSPTVSAQLQSGLFQTWSTQAGAASSSGGVDPIALSATFNVVPYGPAHDARLAADDAVTTARLALRDSEWQATVEAANAYLQSLRQQLRLELDGRAVELAQGALDHVRRLRANGDATEDDVAAAELALAQSTSTRDSDRVVLEGALADLSDRVGRTVDAVMGEPPVTSDPADPGAADAIAHRSDVQRAEMALAAQQRAAAASVRSALPSARAAAAVEGGDGAIGWSAGLSYGTSSFQPNLQASITPAGTGSVLTGTKLTVSLGLTVPFDSAIVPAVDGATLAVTRARQSLERTRQQASLAIASARRSLRTADLSASLARARQARARDAADQAQARFGLGLVARPALDQSRLDADRADLDARVASDAVLLARLQLAIALALDPQEVL